MILEDLVLSIEQSKHLISLGLDMSEMSLCWVVGEMSFDDVSVKHQSVVTVDSKPYRYSFVKEVIPTCTLQEILSMLPEEIDSDEVDFSLMIDWGYSSISYAAGLLELVSFGFDKEGILQAAYDMLCWLIESGFIKLERSVK